MYWNPRSLIVFTLVVFLGLFAHAEVGKVGKIRLLIIDGQNNHDWRKMTPWHMAQLEATGLFSVDVSTTPSGGADWAGWQPDFS